MLNMFKARTKTIGLAGLAIIILTALLFSGCSSTDSSPAETAGQEEGQFTRQELVISGSTTTLQVSEAWASAFMAEYGGSIIVNGGGSGGGIAEMINGINDLANASRQIKPEEIQAAQDAGYDPVEYVVLYDGIAVILSHNLDIEDLTMEQLSKIYTAEITNWSQLGGPDSQIVMAARDTSSGTGEYFLEAVVQMGKTLKDKDYDPTALRLQSNADVVNMVKENDNAIGYIGLGYLEDSLNAVKVEGVMPSVDTVKDDSYPISRGLYIYAPSRDISQIAQAYLDFVFSEQGQQIGLEEGFVPVE